LRLTERRPGSNGSTYNYQGIHEIYLGRIGLSVRQPLGQIDTRPKKKAGSFCIAEVLEIAKRRHS
jgi:hypothetical protein